MVRRTGPRAAADRRPVAATELAGVGPRAARERRSRPRRPAWALDPEVPVYIGVGTLILIIVLVLLLT